ncbi:MAG TPA: type IV pilus assembly protein PilM [Thermodesulfobacteriota bacterium]
MFGFGGKRHLVGLDIGSSSIKLLELKGVRGGYQLVHFGHAPLHGEAIVEGALMDAAAVADTIRSLVQAHKVKTKDVATSVSGHSVIIKKISLPTMSDKELADQIRWEAEQYIPFDINDVNLDFQVLDRGGAGGQMEVMLVAAKKNMITDYSAVVAEAGLNPAVVDVDSFALSNMFEVNYPEERDRTVALINIGCSVLNLNVVRKGTAAFNRDVSIGGKQFTEELQKQFGLSAEDAEAAKLGKGGGGVGKDDVLAALQPVAGSIAGEVSRSLDFFGSTAPDERISKILLSGGAARTPGLAEVIAERTGVPVEMANPFKKIAYDPKVFDPEHIEYMGPSAAVAVGLALRKANER